MDSVPVVAITGNVNRDLLGLDSFQEVDITGVTMPVTKHNFIVKDVEKLAPTLRDAFRIAQEGRKGPVLVDIPKDVTAAKCEFTPASPCAKKAAPIPGADQLEQALALLRASKRPFLYAGGGVISSGASGELAAFAEKLDAPVSCSLMCQGGFDQQGSRYLGLLGMHGTKASALAMKHCDLFVAVGTRFSDRVTCNANLFGKHFPIIQIDIDPAEFNKNVMVDVELRGDAQQVLESLNAALEQQSHPDWMRDIASWKENYPLFQKPSVPGCVTPQEVLETLDVLTNSSAILTTEVGQHQMWAAQFYRFRTPRQLVTSGGLGTMGFGLGAAIGAQVANPDRTVVNIAGDGSFHMNCNELSTLSKYQIPVIELLFNNSVLGMVRQWQKLFYGGRFSQTTLERPTNYELLAQAFGVKALTIRESADVRPVLEEALAAHAPVFINCLIDKDCNVLPMVAPGASPEEPILTM